ncbi:MAG TPA: membrane-bound PQQ-dependent dehydrogenase, glucose/quinate/shikimate family [Allosphingosinicella sp.]
MVRALSLAVGLIGLGSLIPGIYLIALGGSPYYAVAGAGLVVVAWLLYRGLATALYVYSAVLLGTLIWAVAEIGLDWWQLAPRGDILFILGLVLLLPRVRKRLHREGDELPPSLRRGPGLLLSISLAASTVVALSAMLSDEHDLEGSLPARGSQSAASMEGLPDDDWWTYGRTWRGNNWSPLRQITPANAHRLEPAWRMQTGDRKRPGDPVETTYETQPIKVGNTLYLCTPHNQVLALDPETGAVRWRFDPKIVVPADIQHLTCRGVSYHDASWPGAPRAPDGECPQRLILTTNDARMFAIDAASGRPCRGFGSGGQVSLWPGMAAYQQGWYQFTSAPLVTRRLIILGGSIYDDKSVGMPSGVIRAFDVVTGKLVWNFDPGNPGSTAPIGPDQHYSRSSPNSWSTAAADEALGMVYLPMGNGAVDQWGGTRPPNTERYTSAILALDLATGRERWVYQTVHHDLWDMDVPSQPSLLDIDIPGRGRVPALVQTTKTGNLFVLDRRTGKPIHAAPERRVPGGPAPGDRLSPTQPFSTATFMPQRPLEERDMWGATMLDQLACRIAFRKLRYEGPFTPPSMQGSLVYPGNFGVFDWGGIAIDPVRQVAFANPDYVAFTSRLIPRIQPNDHLGQLGAVGGSDRGGSRVRGYNPNAGAPFAVALNPFLSSLGLPCQAPPWGYVAGMDLVTGRTVWKHRNGTVRDEAPLPLPIKMGVPSLGGPLATSGGVAFLTSSLDYYIRAYDVTTGRVLWRARLPAGAQATPMTYRSARTGRQYVVAVAGGHGSAGTKMGDSIIAYALPVGFER